MIRTDWTSPEVIFCDFETQSACDLKKEGGRAYARHPTTRVAMCAFRHGERRAVWVNPQATIPTWPFPQVIAGYEVCFKIPDWVRYSTIPLCAHNALEFDAHVWGEKVKIPMTWRDTLPLCRAAALPAGLDQACSQLFGERKHLVGRKAWESLMRAKIVNGRPQYVIGTIAAWVQSIEYCCQDVDLLAKLHAEVIPYCEPDMLRVHQAVNDRGIPIDREMARRVVELQYILSEMSGGEIEEITEEDLDLRGVRSPQKVKAWLEGRGVRLPTIDDKPTLNRDAMRKLLADPEEYGADDLVGAVLRLRQDVVRVTGSKAVRMLEASSDGGRACGQLVYWKAHTGRFAGRAVQPHNLPRGVSVDSSLARPDLTMQEVYAEAERLGCSAGDVLGTLLRPCISNGRHLNPADFSGVEARGACWAAGDLRELDMFRRGLDPYRVLAAKLYGVEQSQVTDAMRKVAKITTLGCQYGMSPGKFQATFGDQTDIPAEAIVKAYRDAHPEIVAYWKQLHEACLLSAVTGKDVPSGRCSFGWERGQFVMRLPSGRRLVYRDVKVEMMVPYYFRRQGVKKEVPTVTYLHPMGWRTGLYGGKLFENLDQGLCRDFLRDGLIRSEDEGLQPCLHVHDEIVTEEGTVDDLCRAMSTPPEWADGFPLGVEGFSASRYFKKPPKGAIKVTYVNGEKR